tara:strand:+ start:822 stop:995 length:174 start_codon:yes stop_codon:yes gene_type:complete
MSDTENKKPKGRQWDGVSRPSNNVYEKNWHDIFGKKEEEELRKSYEQSKLNKKERKK